MSRNLQEKDLNQGLKNAKWNHAVYYKQKNAKHNYVWGKTKSDVTLQVDALFGFGQM